MLLKYQTFEFLICGFPLSIVKFLHTLYVYILQSRLILGVKLREKTILIKNGVIVDGMGRPSYIGDLYIEGGKIATVGKTKEKDADIEINASNLVVSPGFIDMHGHSDYTLLVNSFADSKVRQGVTTEVIGNCGQSAAPILGEAKEEAERIAERYELRVDWTYMGEYLERLEKKGISINVAALVGFGTVRLSVMGYEAREPREEEMNEMKSLIARSLDEGAVGMSTGLRYVPQSYAKTEEVIEISKVVAEKGGIYTSHIRDEGDGGRLIEAIEEAIRIGREAGVSVEISHLKILAKPLWNLCDKMLDLIETARNEGIDVTADQYPYRASGTSLMAWIPKWAREGGNEKLVERLEDPETREKIKEKLAEVIEIRGGGDNALISRFEPNPDFEGKTLTEIAKELDLPVIEAAMKLVEIAAKEKKGIGIVNFNQSEENVRKIMSKPWVMVGTDGYALKPEGVLAKGVAHPRSYGTFPRILGRYVRKEKLISLEEAVRKMTSLPAKKLGFKDRGGIKEGMAADIVIFDPKTVIDKATYMKPHQYPEGIEYVIVNGEIVVEGGKHTGNLPGKVLSLRTRT